MKLNRIIFYMSVFALMIGVRPSVAESFIVDNSIVERKVDCSDGHITTQWYKLKSTGRNFISEGTKEFSFTANDTLYTGLSEWKDFVISDTVGADGMKGKVVSFRDAQNTLGVKLAYLTYPNLAIVRKYITISNIGKDDLKVENVDVENFILTLSSSEAWSCHNYTRDVEFGPYRGSWNDPLIVVHEVYSNCGMAIGNETAGVLKRTETFVGGNVVRSGLNFSTDSFPFRRWLSLGQSWTSPAVFTAVYDKDRCRNHIVENDVQTLIRKYMGTQVEERPFKPMFVYNTWKPFRHDLNEKLILDLAKAASECGVGEFVMDDGWQINLRKDGNGAVYADWGVDTIKFPRGLKPVFDSIKALGMKPGLWISIANMYYNSNAYVNHIDWAVKDQEGKPMNVHGYYTNPTACMGTDWTDYIRDIILDYVKNNGLAYVKLDLAIAASAYIFDDSHSGCYATDHKYHRDHAESYSVIYDRCMKVYDELHKAAPELFIDCTFETAGKLQLMDYGIALHADGNWLSNIEANWPLGSLRARNLAWRRTPALSASSLVIGNLSMEGDGHIQNFKSLAGTLPIMLGDPRRLSPEERAEYKQWSDWLKGLEARHQYMSFRQDLDGFGEPVPGSWDGFSRINLETKSGGLVGVFREDAVEDSRTVVVNGLDPKATYMVKKGFSGEVIAEMTGADLTGKGFKVVIPERIGGELFEIVRK